MSGIKHTIFKWRLRKVYCNSFGNLRYKINKSSALTNKRLEFNSVVINIINILIYFLNNKRGCDNLFNNHTVILDGMLK